MKRHLLLAGATAIIISAAPPASQPASSQPGTPGDPTALPQARLPSFAAELSEAPPIVSGDAWKTIGRADAWQALSRAYPDKRQSARWDYARSLIGTASFAEAFGVLETMVQDDPDLELVPAYQLARGIALSGLNRPSEAMIALNGTGLVDNPEACAWRMRTLANSGLAESAIGQVNCALPALRGRRVTQSAPFLHAASRAAIAAGKPELALEWLAQLPDRDTTANLLRGRAYLASAKEQEGRLRLARVERSGSGEQKIDASLSLLEAEAKHKDVDAKALLKKLDRIRYLWRGGEIEERALRLSYDLSLKANDFPRLMASGATLFRYFEPGPDDRAMTARMQALLLKALAPDSKVPIDRAAGLYWEYRDLTPPGAEGDYLVSRFADRLQAGGLYKRAAELLEHQLFARAKDVAQGPLSAKVATLHILSGEPQKAVLVLRQTNSHSYPQEMSWERARVEAIALTQLGRANEALAVLQDVPGSAGIQAEILWRKKDWSRLAATAGASLPNGPQLSEVDQATILRQAIALAMLGREEDLGALRGRYGPIFAKLPSAPTFDLLTRPASAIDDGAIGRAMASLPSASPAGRYADMLDLDPVAAKKGG